MFLRKKLFCFALPQCCILFLIALTCFRKSEASYRVSLKRKPEEAPFTAEKEIFSGVIFHGEDKVNSNEHDTSDPDKSESAYDQKSNPEWLP